MPFYEYECERGCGRFDLQRRLAQRDEPVACPQCRGAARRVLSISSAVIAISRKFHRFDGIDRTLVKSVAGSGPWEELCQPKGVR